MPSVCISKYNPKRLMFAQTLVKVANSEDEAAKAESAFF